MKKLLFLIILTLTLAAFTVASAEVIGRVNLNTNKTLATNTTAVLWIPQGTYSLGFTSSTHNSSQLIIVQRLLKDKSDLKNSTDTLARFSTKWQNMTNYNLGQKTGVASLTEGGGAFYRLMLTNNTNKYTYVNATLWTVRK